MHFITKNRWIFPEVRVDGLWDLCYTTTVRFMKRAKIIVGQTRSSFSDLIGLLAQSADCTVEIVEQGHEILGFFKSHAPDLVILQTSVQSPDAVEICRFIKTHPQHHLIPVLLIAEPNNSVDYSVALQAGCDDILTEPINCHELFFRVQSLLRLRALNEENAENSENVLYTLAQTIEAKDPYTRGHADRVAFYAVELGRACGLNPAELEILKKGGLLHDIGKIAIPDAVLLKPGRYTPEEFTVMKRHPGIGYEICQKLSSVKKEVLPLIRHHHERLDGTGYPDGLKGEQIPTVVRIVTIVDIYDALRSRRTYKEAFSVDQSFQIMWEEANKGWWDKEILKIWEDVVRSRKIPAEHLAY